MVDELFKDRKPNIQKLLSFGFAEQNDIFSYSENLADGQFKMIVSISRAGTVNAAVWDCESDDQYVLHRVPGAHGSFVGRIRSCLLYTSQIPFSVLPRHIHGPPHTIFRFLRPEALP